LRQWLLTLLYLSAGTIIVVRFSQLFRHIPLLFVFCTILAFVAIFFRYLFVSEYLEYLTIYMGCSMFLSLSQIVYF
jgi:hypothetical protein